MIAVFAKSGAGQWLALALRVLAGLLAMLCLAGPTQAQVSNQYTNSTSGPINDLSCGVGTELTRTFTVGTGYAITDVNIGVSLSHTFRADLVITLTSPQGTVVTLMDSTAGAGDNLSDLFDDAASQSITQHNSNAPDSTSAVPPYAHSFRPQSALSAFNGQYSAGTWTLTICDDTSLDTGTFTRSDLYITGTTVNDLSLTKTVSSTFPVKSSTITYTLTASSAASSSATATGVTVIDVLPGGVSFVSSSGSGTYNNGTGVWSVGSLAAGASATLTITVTVTANPATTITNSAQITASSQPDPDSTVNNSATGEDDYAAVTFTVASPSLNVTKTTTVLSDPVNGTTNPMAMPGATVRYCVAITNSGNIAIGAITLSDSLPGNISYVAGSMKSGSNCSTAATAEDDDAAGTDESDPVGASFSSSLISGSSTGLAIGATVVLTYNVTIN